MEINKKIQEYLDLRESYNQKATRYKKELDRDWDNMELIMEKLCSNIKKIVSIKDNIILTRDINWQGSSTGFFKEKPYKVVKITDNTITLTGDFVKVKNGKYNGTKSRATVSVRNFIFYLYLHSTFYKRDSVIDKILDDDE